jgi:alkylation response protein AidB-like acyl-CoA dehydrogenase
MDVRLGPEQKALRDSAAQVVDRLGVRAVGQLDDAERAAKLDAAVEAAGWRELRAADETGGPLASAVEAGLLAEELARGLADTAFVGPTLAADLRRRAGAPAATAPETVLLTGDLGALAVVGDPCPPDDAVAVDAAGATTALVLIPTGAGWALGWVRLPPAQIRTDLTRAMAPCGAAAEVALLPDQQHTLWDDDLAAWTALGLALTSADLVGTMRGAVALGCDYAKERQQYGSPIGSFQAVQHLLADAFVAMEGSRSVALHAAWAVDALPAQEALAAGALAKAYCARAARTACESVIQVHGGIGNTWECVAHVHLRRALLSTDLLGGAGANLDRVLQHRGLKAPQAIGGAGGLR